MINSKKILEINNISYQLSDADKVLDNISFEMYVGDRIGFIGPNGAGKTTLFLSIAGVNKLSAGDIILLDHPVVSGEFRSELGMVFQNQDDQIFCPTVKEDIAFGPINMGLSKEEVKQRVDFTVKLLGLEPLIDRLPHQLSGGEKRLVAIAGIIAMDPQLIIYDEPTSNLDMRYRRKLIEFIKRLSFSKGLLIASHDLEFVLEVCNRVILIDEGRIIADGKPIEIFNNQELLLAHGLEAPYSLHSTKYQTVNLKTGVNATLYK